MDDFRGDRPMAMGVSVHRPEVASARVLPVGSTVISLGRKNEDVDWVRAKLFLDNAEVAGFVADLVDAVDGVRPGFLLEVLKRLT